MIWRGWKCGCTRFYVDDQHWYRWLLLIDVFASVGIHHGGWSKFFQHLELWNPDRGDDWRGWLAKGTNQASKKGCDAQFFLQPTELCCQWAAHERVLEAAHKAAKEEREQRAVHARKEREEVRDAAWLGKFCECLWFCLRKLQGGAYKIPSCS